MFPAAVITVSDSCFEGRRVDQSGPAVADLLRQHSFDVVEQATVPDEIEKIQETLLSLCERVSLVVTTGGTGLSPRDVTPEATLTVCDRRLDGLAEQMRAEGRKETAFSVLSRGVCGTRGKSLILNVPGSPRGASSSLRSVLPVLPHALALLAGEAAPHEEAHASSRVSPEQAT